MIVSRKRKYVFVSTPKTGTHTLYHLLQVHFDGERVTGAKSGARGRGTVGPAGRIRAILRVAGAASWWAARLSPRFGPTYGERLGGAYHRREIPDFASTFFLFTTVRNPLDRFLSAYNSLSTFDPYLNIYKKAIGHLDIDSFVAWTSEQNWRSPPKLRGIETLIPMGVWLDGLPLQRCVKLENLKNEFRRLPFVDAEIEIPRLLSRPHDDLLQRVNAATKSKIQAIYEGDFLRFGYVL